MQYKKLKIAFITALLAPAGCATSPADDTSSSTPYIDIARPSLAVDMQVLGDQNSVIREYPVNNNPQHYRAYVQANQGERYQLRVTNNTGQRVGLVIAVDGRNILNGKQSSLGSEERMYILEPYRSNSYDGWRTGQNQTNRFFFTDAANSYAAAWGDNSAMGVIAMAVYAEKAPIPLPRAEAMTAAPAAPAAAGTGFGESTYSPSHTVVFEPVTQPMEKLFLKYEWQQTLCKKQVLPECRPPNHGSNRFWPDNGGYTPPPPSH